MMILTVVSIAIFKTTTVLGNAYGLCVSAMMFITTILACLTFLMVFDAPLPLIAAFFLFYGFVDCVFLSANLEKVRDIPSQLHTICVSICRARDSLDDNGTKHQDQWFTKFRMSRCENISD